MNYTDDVTFFTRELDQVVTWGGRCARGSNLRPVSSELRDYLDENTTLNTRALD